MPCIARRYLLIRTATYFLKALTFYSPLIIFYRSS
jgi:hypothetical protein